MAEKNHTPKPPEFIKLQSDIVNEGLKHIPASHAQMQALNVASLGQTWIRLHPESSQIPENITSLQQLKSGLPPEVANNQNNVGKYWEATLVLYFLPAHFHMLGIGLMNIRLEMNLMQD